MDEIFQKLEQIIAEKGWSLYRFSKETNIPLSTIRNIFSRTCYPTLPTLYKISEELDIPISYFFISEISERELSSDDEEVLSLYKCLNDEQKGYIISFMKSMIEVTKK